MDKLHYTLLGLLSLALICVLVIQSRCSASEDALESEETLEEALPPSSLRLEAPHEHHATPFRPYQGCGRGGLSDEYYTCRRKAVLQGCGDVCDTSGNGTASLFFNAVRKHVDCKALWANAAIDEAVSDQQWPPPQEPPAVFLDDFLYHGRVKGVWGRYYKDRYAGGDGFVKNWTYELVEGMRKEARAGTLAGNYGAGETNNMVEGLRRMNLHDKVVLVIGSEIPWVEACVLEAGAKEVHTLEYGRLESQHPLVKTFTPDMFRARVLSDTMTKYDRVVTFSSVEHSGLGRYGDAINPWGDLQAIARAWCITQDEGQILIGVPGDSCAAGPGELVYNAHRCYHGVMWTHLTANWAQLFKGPAEGHNRFHVLRKLPPAPLTTTS